MLLRIAVILITGLIYYKLLSPRRHLFRPAFVGYEGMLGFGQAMILRILYQAVVERSTIPHGGSLNLGGAGLSCLAIDIVLMAFGMLGFVKGSGSSFRHLHRGSKLFAVHIFMFLAVGAFALPVLEIAETFQIAAWKAYVSLFCLFPFVFLANPYRRRSLPMEENPLAVEVRDVGRWFGKVLKPEVSIAAVQPDVPLLKKRYYGEIHWAGMRGKTCAIPLEWTRHLEPEDILLGVALRHGGLDGAYKWWKEQGAGPHELEDFMMRTARIESIMFYQDDVGSILQAYKSAPAAVAFLARQDLDPNLVLEAACELVTGNKPEEVPCELRHME